MLRVSRLLPRSRCLATAATARFPEGTLQAAFANRVARGQLEDDEVQRKVVQFLAATLKHATAAAREEGGRPSAWAWPVQTLGTGGLAVAEDHRRVAEYTARLAAENTQRVREQARSLRKGASGAPASQLPRAVTPQAGAAATVGLPSAVQSEEKAAAKAQPRQRPARRSVYMHGPVGTGKTMLLDLFHRHAREAGLRVIRKHFYEVMLELHQQIHEIQEERPVEVAANRLADKVDVLCFDEFQVMDIQDAAMLPRLFEILFLRGVVTVMTSNTSPQLLYRGGLNRHVHLPAFIGLLDEHCVVLGLSSPGGDRVVDYRRRAEAAEAAEHREEGKATVVLSYFCGPDAEQQLQERWLQMLGGSHAAAKELRLPMGRSILLPEAAGGSCLVSFQELCGTERGEADFLALAEAFDTVLLSGVPRFASLESSDEVRRFVKLLDVFYDRRVRLVMAAAAPVDDLFGDIRTEVSKGNAEELAWRTTLYSADGKAGMAPSAVGTLWEAVRATERAESRLREMHTRRYWQNCSDARGTVAET